MRKAIGTQFIQDPFAGVSKGRMAQIMSQGNGLSQILVQAQGAGNGTGNLCHFQRMGQTGTVMVTLRSQKYLGLMFESSEGFAMENPVTVALICSADVTGLFLTVTPPCVFAQ